MLTADDVDCAGGPSVIDQWRATFSSIVNPLPGTGNDTHGALQGAKTSGAWVEAGSLRGYGPTPGLIEVEVSLAGAEFTMLGDGKPMRGVIQELIVQASSYRRAAL